jgi:DinB superfamily
LETPQLVLSNMEQIRLGTLQRLSGLAQSQLDWRPPQDQGDQWSLGEVFMHLAIDEIYVRELIARPLLEGIQPPEDVRFLPPPPPAGTRKVVIQYWFERARQVTRRFLEEWPPAVNLNTTHEGGLSPMNGLEWFEGYASHEAFHHRQIDRLIAVLR